MTNHILQYVLYLLILVLLAVPLGKYMYHIMTGERTFLSPCCGRSKRGSANSCASTRPRR